MAYLLTRPPATPPSFRLLSAMDRRAIWMHELFDRTELFPREALPLGVKWHRHLWWVWQRRLTELDMLQQWQSELQPVDVLAAPAFPIIKLRQCAPHGVHASRKYVCGAWYMCPYCYARKFAPLAAKATYIARYVSVQQTQVPLTDSTLLPVLCTGLQTTWQRQRRQDRRGSLYGQLFAWAATAASAVCAGRVVTIHNTDDMPTVGTVVDLQQPTAARQLCHVVGAAFEYPAQWLIGPIAMSHALAVRMQFGRWHYKSGAAFVGRRHGKRSPVDGKFRAR